MKLHKIDLRFKTFNPKEYLKEYYSRIGNENYNLLKFFSASSKFIAKNSVILEFGGGPTIFSLISTAPLVKEIHFSDYLDINLDEVKLWKNNSPKAFNWSSFVKTSLKFEGIKKPGKKDIKFRENLLRKKLTLFLHCDAFKDFPLGKKFSKFYDVVSINGVLDSITSSKKIWKSLLTNISSLLKKNGLIIMYALKEASYWRAGKKIFPAVKLTEKDIKIAFNQLGFHILHLSTIPAEVLDEKSKNYEGYKGFILICAVKT